MVRSFLVSVAPILVLVAALISAPKVALARVVAITGEPSQTLSADDPGKLQRSSAHVIINTTESSTIFHPPTSTSVSLNFTTSFNFTVSSVFLPTSSLSSSRFTSALNATSSAQSNAQSTSSEDGPGKLQASSAHMVIGTPTASLPAGGTSAILTASSFNPTASLNLTLSTVFLPMTTFASPPISSVFNAPNSTSSDSSDNDPGKLQASSAHMVIGT